MNYEICISLRDQGRLPQPAFLRPNLQAHLQVAILGSRKCALFRHLWYSRCGYIAHCRAGATFCSNRFLAAAAHCGLTDLTAFSRRPKYGVFRPQNRRTRLEGHHRVLNLPEYR